MDGLALSAIEKERQEITQKLIHHISRLTQAFDFS